MILLTRVGAPTTANIARRARWARLTMTPVSAVNSSLLLLRQVCCETPDRSCCMRPGLPGCCPRSPHSAQDARCVLTRRVPPRRPRSRVQARAAPARRVAERYAVPGRTARLRARIPTVLRYTRLAVIVVEQWRKGYSLPINTSFRRIDGANADGHHYIVPGLRSDGLFVGHTCPYATGCSSSKHRSGTMWRECDGTMYCWLAD
jgi:hypothetical protein